MSRTFALCLVIPLCLCLSTPAFGEKILIAVKDAETGQTAPARAYLRCAKGKYELHLSEKLQPDVSSWVAVRAFDQAEGTIEFSHTSPAYLLLDGKPVRFSEDARTILEKVDQLIRYTESKAAFRKPEEREETLSLYRQARAIYERLAADR